MTETFHFYNMLNAGIDVVHDHTFVYIFCFLQLLQQAIDAWQFLQHLLYQNTAVKKRTLLGCREHIITQTCCTFADVIPVRGASRPGSIVIIAFSILPFSVRVLDQLGVLSDDFAICPCISG